MSEEPQFFYSFRPRLMAPSHDFQLSKESLDWQIGPRTGRVAYPMIRRIRLGYKPTNMAAARFIAEIWPINAGKLSLSSVTARSIIDIAPQNKEYSGFLRELHRRIAAAKGDCVFEAGFPSWRWWPAFGVALAAFAGVAYVVLQTLAGGQYLFAGIAAFIGAWFLWQIWHIVMRNRPRRYTADAIPDDVLPK